MTEKEIRKLFSYKKPSSEAASFHEWVRKIFTETAVDLGNCLPSSRERSLMLTKLQEALMWANASIALHWERVMTKNTQDRGVHNVYKEPLAHKANPDETAKRAERDP